MSEIFECKKEDSVLSRLNVKDDFVVVFGKARRCVDGTQERLCDLLYFLGLKVICAYARGPLYGSAENNLSAVVREPWRVLHSLDYDAAHGAVFKVNYKDFSWSQYVSPPYF